MNGIGLNSVIATNTAVVEAARFLAYGLGGESEDEPRYYSPLLGNSAVRRLLEFCNFAELATLNDKIYTLPCESPHDIGELQLVRRLKDAGVLETLSSDSVDNDMVQSVYHIIGHLGNDRIFLLANGTFQGEEVDLTNPDVVLYDLERMMRVARLRQKTEKSACAHTDTNAPESFRDALVRFNKHLHFYLSPANNYVVHQIRNVMYWLIAERLNAAYAPDVFRCHWLESLNYGWHATLAQTVYGKVADAFKTSVKDLLKEDEPLEVLVPPIPALLLAEAESEEQVIERLIQMRVNFTRFRRSFEELEESRRGAVTLDQRRRICKKIEALFEAISEKYESRCKRVLAPGVGFTEDVSKIVTSPLEPDSYAGLVKLGIRKLRKWWTNRPLLRLFQLTERLERLPDYPSLSQRLLAGRPTAREIARFSKFLQVTRAANESRVEAEYLHKDLTLLRYWLDN